MSTDPPPGATSGPHSGSTAAREHRRGAPPLSAALSAVGGDRDDSSDGAAGHHGVPPARPGGGDEYRARPCAGAGRVCPWRRDADLTAYTDQDMATLRAASRGDTRGGAYSLDEVEQLSEARRMSCHLDQPDTAHPMRLCAGWLAVIGPHHYGTRLSVLAGRLPADALDPDTSSWPPLVADLEELLARRRLQLEALDSLSARREARPSP